MPTRLTVGQQRKLMRALPASRMVAVKKHCRSCQMRGEGLGDILKSIGKALGPIAKEVGPVVLKELIIPMLKKQAGLGLGVAGGGLGVAGNGLKLAGSGAKKKRRKRRKTKK